MIKPFESCILLINPTRYPKTIGLLKKLLKEFEISIVIETRDKEHFIESVTQFSAGNYQNLLVWGGDGTVHEAINALVNAEAHQDKSVDSPKKSIGFLRGGSGNGIQDSYEIPYSIYKQLNFFADSITHNYTIDVDLLQIENEISLIYGQLVGFGFDVEVLKRRETQKIKSGKNHEMPRSGVFNYIVSALMAYQNYDFQQRDHYTLTIHDGKYALRGVRVNAEFPIDVHQMAVNPLMMEIGTRPYYGRMFKVCPDVVCNDGNMDAYLFNFEEKTAVICNLLSLWNGRHHKINQRFAKKDKPLIERYEIKKLELHSEKPFNYHIDGELKTVTDKINNQYSLSISVKPRAISFLVPRTFYKKFHPFDKDE
jgi:diacylglycerol kinase family enzyme